MKKEYPGVWGLVLAAFAAVMMVVGIYRQEVLTVFDKAIRICLECIGIG